MIWCDILSALSVFAALLTLVIGTWEAVFFVTLVSAMLSQFSQLSVHVPAEQLQAGMAMFQTLMAVFMIIGPALGTFVYQQFGITVAVAVMGVEFLLSACGIGLSTNLMLTLVLQFVNGLFFPCIHVGVNTLILKASEESYIGRVNGVLTPLFMGMMVLMMSAAGLLKQALTLVGAYGLAGVLFLVGALTVVPLFGRKLAAESEQENGIRKNREGESA